MTDSVTEREARRAVARSNLRAVVDRLLRREERDARTLLQRLQDARNAILADLTEGRGTEFGQARAQALLRSVDREIRRLRAELIRPWQAGYLAALQQGDRDMAEQGRAVIPDASLPLTGIDPNLIQTAELRSADLVAQVSENARSRLNDIIRRSAIGAATPAEVAEAIGRVLSEEGRPTGVFGTLATQVARVHRTEVAQLHEVAGLARAEEIDRASPYIMLKTWIATRDSRTRPEHRIMNGATVPVSEHFNYTTSPRWSQVSYEEAERRGGTLGIKATGPHDANLPAAAAVNCRCTTGLRRGPRRDEA